MKFFYRLLIPAIFLPLFSLAQGNYKQGFIINLKGDTTKGYIDLREWGTNPQSINFKQSLDKAPQVLTVNDIRAFELPGYVTYKSFATSISMDETNLQRLEHERDTSTKMDNVFLKVEQKGKNVILYSYMDNLKERFYLYDSQTNRVTELTYRIYYVQNDQNNVSTVSQNGYKQQLLLCAQKFNVYNDNLKPLLEDANYERSDLVGICRKINGSTKGEEKSNMSRKYVRFFAGIGASYNTINLKGTIPLYNVASSHSSITPRISAGFSFYPVPDVSKSLLKLEIAYSSASYKTNGTLYFFDPSKISTYEVVQHTISFIPQFQYNIYNTDPFKFYIDAGLSVNFSQYGNNSVYNPVTQYSDNDFIGFNNRWFSVPFKAGIILNKKVDISLIYIYPMSISDNAAGHHEDFNYSFTLTTFQAGVSYIF